MGDGPAPFEEITGRARHSMVIATVQPAGGEPAGCLVGLHTRCSIEPARYLVCLSVHNRTHDVASRAGFMAVHHIGVVHAELARWFGEETGDEVDKFAAVEWATGPGDVPVLGGVDDWWVGAVVERLRLGDHTGFVLDPVAGHAGAARAPFTSQDAAVLEPGHPRT